VPLAGVWCPWGPGPAGVPDPVGLPAPGFGLRFPRP
jgi:hypothetical protein